MFHKFKWETYFNIFQGFLFGITMDKNPNFSNRGHFHHQEERENIERSQGKKGCNEVLPFF